MFPTYLLLLEPYIFMQSGFLIQQQVDDTLLLAHSSDTASYGYTPWLQHYYVPTPRRPSRIPSHRPRHRFEVPPRMRSQGARNAGLPFLAAVATFEYNDIILEQQNPQNSSGRINGGLSKECISDFLLSRLSRLTTSNDNTICTICQDAIDVEEEIATLSCSHIYHASCIREWLLIKNQCAICRSSAISDEDV